MPPSSPISKGHPSLRRALRSSRLALCLSSGSLALASSPLETWLSVSPFATPPPPAVAPPSNELELHSIWVDGGHYVFSVYDPSTKKSRWVRLGESGGPIAAREYNAAKRTLVVEFNGHPLTLAFNAEQVNLSDVASNSTSRAALNRKKEALVFREPDKVPPLSASEANRLGQVAERLRARLQAQQAPTPEASLASSNKS